MQEREFQDVEALGDAILPGPSKGLNVVRVPFGTNNSDMLSRLARRLTDLDENLIPIHVRPPFGGLDAGTVGLAQIADGFFARENLAKERTRLIDPSVRWLDKIDLVRDCIERFQARAILLCDEPHDWSRSLHDSNRYSGHARDLASLVLDRVDCRRVITSKRPSTFAVSEVFFLGERIGPFERSPPETWGALASSATAVAEGLRRHLRAYSRLEVGLLVALAHVSSFARSRPFLVEAQSPSVLGKAVIDELSGRAGYADLLLLWRTLSLLRRPCDAELIRAIAGRAQAMTSAPDAFDLLTRCLLTPIADGYEFPAVLREVANEGADPQERQQSHARIARIQKQRYESAGQNGALSDGMEAFHHASESGDTSLFAELQPFFVDQLDARGRALSRQRRYSEAVKAFRQAVIWDEDDDYAHHYLAYNLDVEGRRPNEVESHYRQAIELDRSNVWWWSRYITFLVVRGRNPDARRAWGEALEELSSRAQTDPVFYEHLHLWVARILLHRMRLDFARQVLDDVPEDVRNENPRFKALRRYLLHLDAARNQRDVLPLTTDIDGEGKGPHLSARYDHDGKQLARWLPGRVDDVTKGHVEMTVAVEDASPSAGRVTRSLTMPRQEFDSLSRDIRSDRLEVGTFVELAFYGQAEKPVIRVRPMHPWHDENLPYIFPRPDRYLQRAETTGG